MPDFEIDCEDKKTSQYYKVVMNASNLRNAKIKAVNDGHRVAGFDIAPEGDVPPTPKATSDSEKLQLIHDELRHIRKHTRLVYFLAVVFIVLNLLWIFLYLLSAFGAFKRGG